MRRQRQLNVYSAKLVLNPYEVKKFAKKHNQYLLDSVDESQELRPSYFLNKFEQELIERSAAKQKNNSQKEFETVSVLERSMETADTSIKPQPIS